MTLKARAFWMGASPAAIALLALTMLHGEAASPKAYTTWSEYGGSGDSSQYSALTQINRNNVRQLEVAWFYHVDGEPDRMPFSPLVVGDVMYVAGAGNTIVALSAATGKALWTAPYHATERGLAYWEKPKIEPTAA